MTFESICVFCGSSGGDDPRYVQVATEFGRQLAERGLTLIYGGGGVGIMGAVADGVIELGGDVIGVIPHGLASKERMHTGVTKMHMVDSMHQRKALMVDLADAFVALPGGMGTLEEFCEIFTWGQLGIHGKPFALYNALGYFDPFVAFLDHMTEEGFLREDHRGLVSVDEDLDSLMRALANYQPPIQKIWIDRTET